MISAFSLTVSLTRRLSLVRSQYRPFLQTLLWGWSLCFRRGGFVDSHLGMLRTIPAFLDAAGSVGLLGKGSEPSTIDLSRGTQEMFESLGRGEPQELPAPTSLAKLQVGDAYSMLAVFGLSHLALSKDRLVAIGDFHLRTFFVI